MYKRQLFVQDNSFDVQNVLGDQQSKFIYEFYITAKAAPKYKYRIMFVAFGLSLIHIYLPGMTG